MRRLLIALALFSALANTGSAAAADRFKNGADAYTVGMYSSAARHWLELAEKGHAPAQYNVGRMLYYGKGVRRNPIEAYKWFLIASSNGVQRSTEATRIAGNRMTRREIVEATVRARDWHSKQSR